MKITGIKSLQKKLKRLENEAREEARHASVSTGYTASYALYVHEMPMKHKGEKRRKKKNQGRFWDPQGRAQNKFLETPARQNREELGAVVVTVVKTGKKVRWGLLAAARLLQRMSQLLVPVDTGNLKNSAFTEFDR